MVEKKVIPAIPCKEKFKEGIYDSSLLEQFEKSAGHMTEWLCPDTASFNLLNLPDINLNGKDFKLVVDYCDESLPGCRGEDNGAREAQLETITINSKVIYQAFDGKTYQNTGKLVYLRGSEMNSGLVSNICVVKEFLVTLNQLHILSARPYDASNLLDVGTKKNVYDFRFWNTIIRGYNRVPGERSLQDSSGIYQAVLIQDSKILETKVAIITYD